MYLLEDHLKDAHNTIIESKPQFPPYVLVRAGDNHAKLWESPDDCLGTVSKWVVDQFRLRVPVQKDLPTIVGACPGHSTLISAVSSLCIEDLRDIVLPYLDSAFPADAAKLRAALDGVKDVKPPGQCSPADNWKWALLLESLAHRFYEWRKEKRPPSIPHNKWPTDFSKAKKCTEIGNWQDLDLIALPVDGKKFAEWELGLLSHLREDHQVLKENDKEVAVSGAYDPFLAIGSTFLLLPEIPSWPYKCINQTLPIGPPSMTPTVPCTPVPVPTPSTSAGSSTVVHFLGDQYDPVRCYIKDTILVNLDLNRLTKEQRNRLKEGYPHNHS